MFIKIFNKKINKFIFVSAAGIIGSKKALESYYKVTILEDQVKEV